ncbi:MAG: hypothetical protein ACREN6_13850 [Gemmatimonadaceae bacterium]
MTGPTAGPSSVSIAGFAFSPSTPTMRKGTTITWTNNDVTIHTVSADANAFDAGAIAVHQSFMVTRGARHDYEW